LSELLFFLLSSQPIATDLNHLSANNLQVEVGQSKQCLLDHGIKTSVFAVPKNIATDKK
jgi:hypothetical protein